MTVEWSGSDPEQRQRKFALAVIEDHEAHERMLEVLDVIAPAGAMPTTSAVTSAANDATSFRTM